MHACRRDEMKGGRERGGGLRNDAAARGAGGAKVRIAWFVAFACLMGAQVTTLRLDGTAKVKSELP